MPHRTALHAHASHAVAATVDRRADHGPFDVVGDVHGCYDELRDLLDRLGYRVTEAGDGRVSVGSDRGRCLVLLGDLVDRGPKVVPTLRLAMGLARGGCGHVVGGNHDDRLRRHLLGRPVAMTHGLAESVEQLDDEPPAFRETTLRFLERLPHHLLLDGGALLVAHAGLPEAYHGRDDRDARRLATFGEWTGENDEFGHPIRVPWADTYRGEPFVVYGHTPVALPVWTANTVDIDTGCVFGGELTALRWPERETVSVPARAVYDAHGRIRPVAVAVPGE